MTKVCILTAGKGTRMGKLTLHTNKVLLPLNDKAIISHIIESFPENTEFVLALGYKGSHIKQYVSIAHPNTKFSFVNVKNFDGPGSGPGLSLLSCKEYLDSAFWCVCGDTIWDTALENINFNPGKNLIGASHVPIEQISSFCSIEESQGKIVKIYDKDPNSPTTLVFNGLFHINDTELFFNALDDDKLINGEHQISNGFEKLTTDKLLEPLVINSWVDLGNYKSYVTANSNSPNFYFKKNNEYFYEVNNQIIKFFGDPLIVKQRVQRQKILARVTPKLTHSEQNFYSYNKVAGPVIYDVITPSIFTKLLNWLKKELWTKPSGSTGLFKKNCTNFYKNKTLMRVDNYLDKYPDRTAKLVNGKKAQPIHELLDKVPWEELTNGTPTNFHGDLQFDNIIFNNGSFTLIDWRQNFSDSLKYGDIYYDLAKLKVGIDIHLKQLKNRIYEYTNNKKNISFILPKLTMADELLSLLKSFLKENSFSSDRVNIISSIILINMAPLHDEDLANIFWNSGKEQLIDNVVLKS